MKTRFDVTVLRVLRGSACLACTLAAAPMALAQAGTTPAERRMLEPEWLATLRQPVAPSAGEVGEWFPWHATYLAEARSLPRDLGLSAAEVQAWDQQLRALLEAMQATPVLAQPLGFSPATSASIGGLWDGPVAPRGRAPVFGMLMLGAWLPEQIERGPDGRRRTDGETSHLLVGVNSLPRGVSADWMTDDDGEFFAIPPLASPFPGTMLVNGTLIVTRPGKPAPYVPVTQERALRALIAHFGSAEARVEMALAQKRQELADYLSPANEPRRRAEIEAETRGFMTRNRQDEATARQRAEAIERAYIARLRAEADPPADSPLFIEVRRARRAREELAAMSEAQRTAPAWVSAAVQEIASFDAELRATNAPGAAPVMAFNPAFFDPALPRTAMQVLVISDIATRTRNAHRDASDQRVTPARVNLLVLQQSDWFALAERVLK